MLLPAIVSVYTVLLAVFLLDLLRTSSHREEIQAIREREGSLPLVSIIVPMRNEERNVKRCTESLLSQVYPNFEVIAVDDGSEDGTLEVLKGIASKHPNLKVIEGTPTPDGWVGKNHALWQGVKQAKGDWILFVDADTTSEPYMLTSVIKYAEENDVDMLSISTFQVMETFWERVIQPVIISSIYHAFPQKKINDPRSKVAAANGQFILIRRSVYEAVGGHLAVKDRIVEDFALAGLVKGAGYRLRVMRGTRIVRTRMYTSFHEIWEGWTKNLFFGLGRKWELVALSIAILLARGIIPPVLFGWSLASLVFRGAQDSVSLLILAESAFLFVLITYVGWRTTRFFAIPPYYAFTVPLGTAIYIAIILSSAYKVASGVGVTWKKRVYRL
ncbi:MAG TPA: glycosyltransferase family 2 protein [Thermodesulfobacteriota bacterium]|nr:glycosyltransferase family 2 protein [Thermodesulfobacteriota bacterium]